MRIAVTGATGYIGKRLILAANTAGYDVLALSRLSLTGPGLTWQRYDLNNAESLILPKDITAVFHLAANTQPTPSSEIIEQSAAKALINAAESVGAAFIFISSQTACADGPTAYARIKWQIERMTLDAGGLVIRPGQVYGGPERGLFGKICAVVRRSPLLPAFVPAPIIQPVHIDDLITALLACLSHKSSTVFCVGSPVGVTFTSFLNIIARGRNNFGHVFIPVPIFLIYFTSKILRSRLSNKLGLEKLLSLFALKHMETTEDLKRLSLTLRPLNINMVRSGCIRRELLVEGRAILIYLLRMRPASIQIRRYVRAIEKLRKVRALQLPAIILRVPSLLSLLDGSGCMNTIFKQELDWRLNAALMLAEADPHGAQRFLDADKHSEFWLRSTLFITLAILMELTRRVAQIIISPLLYRIGHKGDLRD